MINRMPKRELKQRRKRLSRKQEILNNHNVTHLYIIKNGLYYRPNSSGYTDHECDAGVYPKEEYASEVLHSELVVREINNEDHNEMILEKIKDLKTRLI